jgi:hypothetical protein
MTSTPLPPPPPRPKALKKRKLENPWAKFMGPPSLPPQHDPKTSLYPAPIPPRGEVTSREAFFSNYNEAQMLSIEERVKRIKRAFPGPAGLLPSLSRRETSQLSDSSSQLSQEISKIISSDLYRIRNANGPDLKIDLNSDTDTDILRMNKGPWRELLRELNIDSEDAQGLTSLMNISWIVKDVAKYPVTTRIPFLALVVEEEPQLVAIRKRVRDLKRKNPSIKLMDKTGVIVAAMDKKFVEMYGAELVPGTAIAVQNVSNLNYI